MGFTGREQKGQGFIWGFTLVLCMANALMNDAVVLAAKREAGVLSGRITVGMFRGRLLKFYPRPTARTYRTEGPDEWMTYPHVDEEGLPGTVTFHLRNDRLQNWTFNDRAEVIREYLSEYCSQAFIQGHPKIYQAIRNVLTRVPWDVFLAVTDRGRPVLFSEDHTTGIGRFAISSEIIKFSDDAPSMTGGLTIVKLSTEMEAIGSSEAITGVVAHELAHRTLEHARKGLEVCAREREANQLIKTWGFEQEFQQASVQLGDKDRHGNTACGGQHE